MSHHNCLACEQAASITEERTLKSGAISRTYSCINGHQHTTIQAGAGALEILNRRNTKVRNGEVWSATSRANYKSVLSTIDEAVQEPSVRDTTTMVAALRRALMTGLESNLDHDVFEAGIEAMESIEQLLASDAALAERLKVMTDHAVSLVGELIAERRKNIAMFTEIQHIKLGVNLK